MFSKSVLLALSTLAFSGFTAYAAPQRFQGHQSESCPSATVIFSTVTVTTGASSSTKGAGNNNNNAGSAVTTSAISATTKASSNNNQGGGKGSTTTKANNGGGKGSVTNTSKSVTTTQANNGGKGSNNGGSKGSVTTSSQSVTTTKANNGGKGSNNGGSKGSVTTSSQSVTTTKANNGGKGSTTVNNNGGKGSVTTTKANNGGSATTTTSGAATTTRSTANTGGSNDQDPQKSLTLDPRVIASGFAKDGQDVPTAGQVASLTSTNNFINFCLGSGNLPLTNGQQITTGSCNPCPIGVIPSVDNMPSAKFVNPPNFGTIVANKEFTVKLNIKNLDAGNFVNAKENYFAAPQTLNNGVIVGHTHVVIESIASLADTTPTDPKKFAFFKGINDPAVNGQVSADVTDGLAVGTYRICSINSSSNHQPVIVPIAQHGSLDDCSYFTVTADGKAADNGAAATSSAAGASSVVSSSAAASTNIVSTTAVSAIPTASETIDSNFSATVSLPSTETAAQGGKGAKGGKNGATAVVTSTSSVISSSAVSSTGKAGANASASLTTASEAVTETAKGERGGRPGRN